MNITEKDHTTILRIMEHCIRIENARNRFGDSFDSFSSDQEYKDAISMNIFQIGELANQLSDTLKNQCPDIPWKKWNA